MAAPAFSGTSFMVLSVAIVGILAISLLLLAYYLFLTNCGLAFSWRRHHDVATNTNTVFYSVAAAHRGLDDAAIRRIPTFRYRNHPAVPSECAVCLSVFREGERLRLLPTCLHVFHIDCIDAWLHASANCPLCRAAVSACPPPHVDIVNVLQAADDAVDADIVSPSPGGMAGKRDDQYCIDPDDGDLLMGVQQPVRRSLSMDSCNDKHLYLALQQQQQYSAALQEDGKGESSGAAGRLRRSFFSFSHGRSSRSAAILPI